MPRPYRIIVLFLLPALTLALGWQLGMRFERTALEESRRQLDVLYGTPSGSGTVLRDPQKEVNISLLWSVWRLLINEYIEPKDLQTTPMLYGAVRGMVNAVGDPYTVFMTPGENKDFQSTLSGELQGIGAELAVRDGKVIVVSPLKGSPAEKAGLLPEDEIIEVDGIAIEGLSLQDVVTKIRGKKGTQVTLTVLRRSAREPVQMTIVRANIHVPSVESETKETPGGSVGILTINQFGAETIADADKALREMKGKNHDGLILDLRFNGGGYLDGAVALSSYFLKEGKVVTVEGRGGPPQIHYVSGRPLFPDIPLAVLINQGTASASEIVAGALQDHKRATIIGMKSFGKGTVQEVLDLPGGSSLRVTIAHWLTPGGRNLGKEGVLPDIKVDRTPEEIEVKKDPQMDAAVTWLLEKKDVTKGASSSSQSSR